MSPHRPTAAVSIRTVALRAGFLALSASSHLLAQTTLREHLDATRLRAGRDSFVVIMQGKPAGWQRLTGSRDGSGWRFTDAITIGAMVTQESVVRLDPGQHEISLRQSGQMQSKPMQISLDFAKGRVRGTALTPTHPAGPLSIDTTVAVGTIDDNAVMPLMSAVRWRDSLSITFPVLASGSGIVDLWSLRVIGADSTTVPAGHFDTWKVEMRASRSRMLFHVTRAAPYRVVRMINGPAFEMQLAP